MAGYVPNHQKKKRIFEKREQELEHAIKHGFSRKRITKARRSFGRQSSTSLSPSFPGFQFSRRVRMCLARKQNNGSGTRWMKLLKNTYTRQSSQANSSDTRNRHGRSVSFVPVSYTFPGGPPAPTPAAHCLFLCVSLFSY